MNMKFISGIIIGALLAVGGMWAYKSWCATCVTDSDETSQAQVGELAPNFTLLAQNGEAVELAEVLRTGQPVVLEWFNAECPYVKKFYSVGEMQRLQGEFTQQGVTWLRVVSSAPGKQGHLNQDTAQVLHRMSNANATLLDESGKVGRLYGAQTTPHMYVIDGQGVLVYTGAIDSVRSTDPADIRGAENYVVQTLQALDDGSKVPEPTSAYGCSVKY